MRTAEKKTAVALVLATLAGAASAQMGGQGMRRAKGPETRSQERESPAPTTTGAEQTSASLYDLRMRLLVMPAQAAAWESFYARWMDRTRPAAALEPIEFPGSQALQVLQRQLAQERGRVALTENLYAAAQNLYVQLTPEQQATADQVMPQLLASTAATAARPARVWTR